MLRAQLSARRRNIKDLQDTASALHRPIVCSGEGILTDYGLLVAVRPAVQAPGQRCGSLREGMANELKMEPYSGPHL